MSKAEPILCIYPCFAERTFIPGDWICRGKKKKKSQGGRKKGVFISIQHKLLQIKTVWDWLQKKWWAHCWQPLNRTAEIPQNSSLPDHFDSTRLWLQPESFAEGELSSGLGWQAGQHPALHEHCTVWTFQEPFSQKQVSSDRAIAELEVNLIR